MNLEKTREELIAEIERLEQVNSKLQAQLNQTDFRVLVERIPGIVYLFSTKRGGLFYSSHVEDILYYSPEELMADSMLWHNSIHPEDIGMVNKKIQDIKENSSFSLEYRILDKNGNMHWLEDRSLEFEEAKDEILIVGHALDITERKEIDNRLKQSEARWQFALEGSGDGIWDWNVKTNEVFFSKQWKAMLGYEDHEIANSLSEWEIRVHPEDKEKITQDLEKHFSEKTEFYQNEHRMLCKDGNYKWILDRGKVIDWDNEGKPLRVIGTHSDITNRKKIEHEVIRQNKELAELNASKDKFFSIIAHDLRGPFSGFLGLTQMMENDDMALEQMKQLSKLMHSSAENLFKLLENLLTWASVQKGTIEFNPKKYFLSAILNESIDVLYDFAKQKDIKIINQTPQNLEVTVDYIMLNTIIRNLISNAVKFSNRGGKVIIGAEEKNDQVLIYVKDNGVGMDEKMRNDVFKIDKKTTRKGTEKELSTGLGLLLCKEFIEKHHGKIWIESEVDKGSTFYFTLG